MAITPEYQDYLNGPKWQAKRRKVLRRHRLCQVCHERPATQVHHLTYERIFRERLKDLQAVCGRCHMEIHGIDQQPRRFGKLGRVLARIIG